MSDEYEGYLAAVLIMALTLIGGLMMYGLHLEQPDNRIMAPYLEKWSGTAHEGSIVVGSDAVKDPDDLPRSGNIEFLYSEGVKPYNWPIKEWGVDGKKHPYNAFLLKFMPFKTEKLWIVIRLVAQKLEYAYDKDLFLFGYSDVWQTSRQAYKYMRGDCEDSAMLLADWMIEMGYDARVVLGEIPTGGHAWVVLINKGEVYIVEPTDRRGLKYTPLAKYRTYYHPEYMFDQNTIWVNTGTVLTTDYLGDHWKPIARFKAE